jgi:hypothetical protein
VIRFAGERPRFKSRHCYQNVKPKKGCNMKNVFAVGVTALLACTLAFGQSPEAKKAPLKKHQRVPAKVQKGSASAESKVALNPQPLPPKAQSGPPISPASKASLNPQPLPPKSKIQGPPISPASKVSLNPQPLPPKQKVGSSSAASKVSLNPQPLPPKQAVGAAAGQAKQR